MFGFWDSPDETRKIWVKVDENGDVVPMSDDDIEVVIDDDRYPLDEEEE